MLRVTHDHYRLTSTTTVKGTVVDTQDETVDATYVRQFLGAREFFESLGGTEVHRRITGGGIHVTATNPDGTEVREAVFTPVRP